MISVNSVCDPSYLMLIQQNDAFPLESDFHNIQFFFPNYFSTERKNPWDPQDIKIFGNKKVAPKRIEPNSVKQFDYMLCISK